MIGHAEFHLIALATLQHTPATAGKAAFVVSRPRALIPLQRYINAAVVYRVPLEYRVFSDRSAAAAWLRKP